jgi:hypothetical protein
VEERGSGGEASTADAAPIAASGQASTQPVRKRRKHALPADWQPGPRARNHAQSCGVDPDAVARELRLWADANGAELENWDAQYVRFVEVAGRRRQPSMPMAISGGKGTTADLPDAETMGLLDRLVAIAGKARDASHWGNVGGPRVPNRGEFRKLLEGPQRAAAIAWMDQVEAWAATDRSKWAETDPRASAPPALDTHLQRAAAAA